MRNIINHIVFVCLMIFANQGYSAIDNTHILAFSTGGTAGVLMGTLGTSAYIQLSASTPFPTRRIVFANNTTSTVVIGIGAAGAEVSFAAIGPSTTQQFDWGNTVPIASRLALKAVDAAATSGYITVSLIP